jgi:hypothetical protein
MLGFTTYGETLNTPERMQRHVPENDTIFEMSLLPLKHAEIRV